MQKVLFTIATITLLIGTYIIYDVETRSQNKSYFPDKLTFANGSAVSTAITSMAGPKSQGKCAQFVRTAVQRANGKPEVPAGIESAKDYGPWVQQYGYKSTSRTDSQAQVGDIAILQGQSNHPHGHIAIKCQDGKWRSDFVQNGFWIYSDGSRPSYTIYTL